MALTPRLDLRQSQQLVMTPQLQQAIKLLQLSNMDLADYVAGEVQSNPILEMGERGGDDPAAAPGGEGGGTASDEGLREGGGRDDTDWDAGTAGADAKVDDGLVATDRSLESGFDTSGSSDAALDTDYDSNVFQHDSVADAIDNASNQAVGSDSGLGLDGAGAVKGMGGSAVSDERGLDQTLEDGENLKDFLTRQMAVQITEPAERLIAAHLIDRVDETGYAASDSVEDVAGQLVCDTGLVETVLVKLQTLEPSGVFARDLSECLAIQLRERDRFDPCMQVLVDNLDLLARQELGQLKKLCRVDDEDLSDMISELRTLNPKPGLSFAADTVQPVVPDIFVRKDRAGHWTVELNSDTLPKVLVNSQYVAELTTVGDDKDVKAFVSECVSNANWLVKALDQRAKTILKVATALVKKQDIFFEQGVRFLKPLTLKDIAEEIGMHESTVSRVTSNKFMSSPRGLFERKYFFTSAIASADGGDALSAEAVKHRIKELIDAEDPKKILSDDKLVALLKADGMDIARRTVAKYREALRIPSSVQRRRQKALTA